MNHLINKKFKVKQIPAKYSWTNYLKYDPVIKLNKKKKNDPLIRSLIYKQSKDN